ncbi:MAG: hypothetical protein KF704_00030 [Crocinitomicaceae bacterium]|nr:hypothetical protein [Crocinitomicaceae bacterium]
MQTIRDILEIIYFISGPVVAYFAFKALGQINEAKKQVTETKESRIISSKREAYKIAAEKCEYFMTTIIPLIDNLDRAVKESGVTYFEKSQVEITTDGIKVKPFYKDKDEINKVFNLPNLELFNPLESFSLFFVSGVAEEKIGYLTIGSTYCNTVRTYAPLIVTLSNEKHFNNTLYLFKTWNARQEKENLEKEKTRIDKQLSENKSISIKTIGAE